MKRLIARLILSAPYLVVGLFFVVTNTAAIMTGNYVWLVLATVLDVYVGLVLLIILLLWLERGLSWLNKWAERNKWPRDEM